jgi:hypothetical protein
VTHRFFSGFLPRSESRFVFIFTMVCYTATIDLLGGRLASVVGLWRVRSSPEAASNAHQMIAGPWWDHALMDLLISPIAESLMIISIIELFSRLKFSAVTGIIVATLLFSALHGVTIPIWGIICIPGFFIQGASYVYWRRISFWAGLQVIILIHAFSNLVPFLYTLERKIDQTQRTTVSITANN